MPDIALLDWQTHKVRNLTQEQTKDHLWGFVAWSNGGKSSYANRSLCGITFHSDIYRVDVASGNRENLTLHQGQVLLSSFVPLCRWTVLCS